MWLNSVHRSIGLLWGLSCLAGGLVAGTNLIDRSPFIPEGFDPAQGRTTTAATGARTAGAFSFRGLYVLEDTYWFLVMEPQSTAGRWVTLGGHYDAFEVRHYDPSTKTLVIYSDNTEHRVVMENLVSNPVPIPVQGAPRVEPRQPVRPTPTVRRTIRPTSSRTAPSNRAEAPNPPEWLAKLREDAEKRRNEMRESQEGEEDLPPKE